MAQSNNFSSQTGAGTSWPEGMNIDVVWFNMTFQNVGGLDVFQLPMHTLRVNPSANWQVPWGGPLKRPQFYYITVGSGL